jgi:hypothetical protein
MGINLPNPRNVFLPAVPHGTLDEATIRRYLEDLKTALELQLSKQFDNTYTILSTGVTGTFVDSGSNTITVVNGIITNLT